MPILRVVGSKVVALFLLPLPRFYLSFGLLWIWHSPNYTIFKSKIVLLQGVKPTSWKKVKIDTYKRLANPAYAGCVNYILNDVDTCYFLILYPMVFRSGISVEYYTCFTYSARRCIFSSAFWAKDAPMRMTAPLSGISENNVCFLASRQISTM